MKPNIKIAAAVILYHPKEEESFKNISSYSIAVDKLFLFDNSEKESTFIKTNAQKLNSNTIFLHDGDNKGIAFRLNQAVQFCIEEGFDWLLTMDQDSSFQENGFAKYLQQFGNYKKDDVAIFGVNYLPKLFPVSDVELEVLSTITSASLVNIQLAKKIGKYNEDLFIDFVDAEYSYRAHNLKYKIIQFRNIILNHEMGYIQNGRSLKNFKITPRVMYSPIRIYYIVRNYFYMLHKFPGLPEGAKKELKGTLWLLKNSTIYHKKRWQVIKNIFQGYFDYKNNKMGKKASK